MKRTLAAVLAWCGGAVDAIGFLVLYRLFTAHMSGNSVRLTVGLAIGDTRTVVERAAVIAAFIAGAVLGGFVMQGVSRRHARLAFAVMIGLEIALLCGFWIAAGLSGFLPVEGSATYYASLVLAAVAMAVQGAALRRVEETPVHTNFVTGVLLNAGEALATVAASRIFDRCRNRKAERVLAVLVPVYAAYIAGGFVGALAFLHATPYSPLVAIVPLTAACVYGATRGVAQG